MFLVQRSTISKRKSLFLCLFILHFCVQSAFSAAIANDIQATKALEDNSDIQPDYTKRDWKTDLRMWGKRDWNNLHSGWGKRDLVVYNDDLGYPIPSYEKKAWQRLQGSWGKRFIPSEEDIAIRQLAAALEDNDAADNVVYLPENDFEKQNLNKRGWDKFNEGWGKRSQKWDKFKGSWGKREPAWNNLKGLWGKRSAAE